ncbi:MAG: sugar kinase [Lentilitoribacter sp.]
MKNNSKSNSVLCAGRLYCDLIFTDVPRMPTIGTETFAGSLELHTGGGAFITAATLAKLGLETSLLSTLPAAPFDKFTKDEVARNNIDVGLCASAAISSDPQITVAITGANDRAFLSRKTGNAFPQITANELEPFDHIHIGELRTLEENPDIVSKARDAGLTISLDCGWDDELMSNAQGLADLISKADVFLPNEMEFEQLQKLGISTNTAPLTIVKCGANGSIAHSEQGKIQVPTTSVEVIDATGAGDAFNGGFISKWLTGSPLNQCLQMGNKCGALAVQGSGGTASLNILSHSSKENFASKNVAG